MSIIKIKRTISSAATGANLQFGELAYKDNTHELYIGSSASAAILIASASTVANNSGDVTLDINSGLTGISTGDQAGLALGVPSSITTSSTNSVTTNTHTHSITGFLSATLSGANNGLATLDSSGKILVSQLPSTIAGALEYIGTYDIVAQGSYPAGAIKGNYYVSSSVSGTALGKTWTLGDLIIYNGSSWDQVQGGDSDVISVNGKTGIITLAVGDITGAAPLNNPTFTGTVNGTNAYFSTAVTAGTLVGTIDGGIF